MSLRAGRLIGPFVFASCLALPQALMSACIQRACIEHPQTVNTPLAPYPLPIRLDPADPHRFLQPQGPTYPQGQIHLAGYNDVHLLTVPPHVTDVPCQYRRFYQDLICTMLDGGNATLSAPPAAPPKLNLLREFFNLQASANNRLNFYQREGAPGTGLTNEDCPTPLDRRQFNLDCIEPAYLNYWHKIVDLAYPRNMIVQIVIFDAFHLKCCENVIGGCIGGMKYDYYYGGPTTSISAPCDLNPSNCNIPNPCGSSRAPNSNHVQANIRPQDIWEWMDWTNAPLFNYQKQLVHALVDRVGMYPNVIYELASAMFCPVRT